MKKRILFLTGTILFIIGVCLEKTAGAQSSSQKKKGSELSYRQVTVAKHNNANPLITLDLKDVLLREALKQIADQAKAGIYFNRKLVPHKRISLHLENVPLGEALRQALKGTNLEAFSSARNILLRRKTKIQPLGNTEEEVINVDELIGGIITDSKTGETLPGVNVMIKGTTTGTSTGSEGEFELEVPTLQDTLVVSFVGYQTREVPIGGRTELDIQLTPKAVEGEEVVVVGYGQQQRRDLTSSVTSVRGTDIAKVPAANIGNALFGTSGLQVIQSSGQPGQDDPQIFVRGISSLSGGRSQPLFVLDGVVVRDARSITQLDPDNIESVSVLKDASATAVYGVEGANGVIVVETKQGRPGAMEISVNTSAGLQAPTVKKENVDSYTFAQAYNEAQLNDGVDPAQLRFSSKVIEAFRTGSDPIIYPDIDWVDYLTKPAAPQSRTNISISGGTGDVRYYVAGGYLKQNGFFRDFDTDATFDSYKNNPSYDRYNLRSNLNIDVTPSTQLSVNVAGRIGSRINLRTINWQSLYQTQPFNSPGIIEGKKVVTGDRYIPGARGGNILHRYGNGYNQHIESALNLQLAGTQRLDMITKGLQLQLKGAYNAYFTQHKIRGSNVPNYVPFYRTDVDPTAVGDSTIVFRKQGVDQVLQYSENYGKDRDWYVEARLQYSRDFGPHGVEGLLLAGQRKRYYPSSFRGIPRQLINTVGRLNYNYDDRYLLEASMGYNGSENFAEGRRFGLFPAVSGGWILTNEPYFPEVPFLDFLKLRASYGLVGNDQGIGRFLYLPDEYHASGPGYNFGHAVPQDYPGASEGRLGNPAVTWEVARKQNYGVDLRLLGDRLDLSADYFYEFRDDILTTLNTVPSYVAADLPAVNVGQVENRGFEAELTWRQQVGDFFYSVGGTVTHARNKVVEMDELPRNEPYQRRTGQPVGQPFGWVFDGFYSADDFVEGTLTENLTDGELREELPKPNWTVKPGYLKYKDLNGDGAIDEDDTRPIGYSQVSPEYSFGANLEVQYRNVDLSMRWAAATHVSDLFFAVPNRLTFGTRGGGSMRQWQWDGRWTPEKDPEDILYPRLSLAALGDRNQRDSDFWLIDASYLRLKQVEVGYTFGPGIAGALGAQHLRVYANAYNPLTFSHMMETYSIDPEQTGNRGSQRYPVMKVFNIGIKLDF